MKALHTVVAAAALLAAGLAQAQAQIGPNIFLTPSATSVTVGDTFTIDIGISGVSDLYSWEIDLTFGPSALVSLTGQSLGSAFDGAFFVPGTVDGAAGTVTGIAAALFGPTGVGGGTIGRLTFEAASVGEVTFGFSRVLLGDSNLEPVFISTDNWNGNQLAIVPVPEPATALMAALGLVATAAAVRRHRAA